MRLQLNDYQLMCVFLSFQSINGELSHEMSNFLFSLNVAMSFVFKVQKKLEVNSGTVLTGARLKEHSPHFDVTIHRANSGTSLNTISRAL